MEMFDKNGGVMFLIFFNKNKMHILEDQNEEIS